MHSKAAAIATAAAAPAPTPPPGYAYFRCSPFASLTSPRPTEEDLMRAALNEYVTSAKQREALGAILSKWGRSPRFAPLAARMLADPSWQIKLVRTTSFRIL